MALLAPQEVWHGSSNGKAFSCRVGKGSGPGGHGADQHVGGQVDWLRMRPTGTQLSGTDLDSFVVEGLFLTMLTLEHTVSIVLGCRRSWFSRRAGFVAIASSVKHSGAS